MTIPVSAHGQEHSLWVDDERPAPGTLLEGWWTRKTSESACQAITAAVRSGHPFDEISLDHDLGGDDTGMKVLEFMIYEEIWPSRLTIHTQNPPARAAMLLAANHEAPPWVDIYIKTW